VLLEEWNTENFPIGVLVGVLSQIKPEKWIWHYCSVSGRQRTLCLGKLCFGAGIPNVVVQFT
jgi:hypothetical protein